MRRQDLKAGRLFLNTIPAYDDKDGGWPAAYESGDDKSAEEFYIAADGLDPEGSAAVFAEFWASQGDFSDEGPLRWLFLALYLHNNSGHIRMDLSGLKEWIENLDYSGVSETLASRIKMSILELERQIPGLIKRSPQLFGEEGSNKPFIVSERTQYLYSLRRYRLESRFIDGLIERAENQGNPFQWLSGDLSRKVMNFQDSTGIVLNESVTKIIGCLLDKRLVLLSGGPGTGKTTTIARLVLFLGTLSADIPLRLGLCAPTGRAAKRMNESIRKELNPASRAHDLIDMALNGTLHKLLGFSPSRRKPKYNEENRLPVDLLIVDEASMIDLAMMDALFAALPDNSRILLVGDRDQLPSVEAGALFGDLIFGFGKGKHLLDDSIVLLEKVYRSDKGVLEAAEAVRKGKRDKFFQLGSESFALMLNPDIKSVYSACLKRYHSKKGKGFSCSVSEWNQYRDEIDKAFWEMDDLALLSVTRKGPLGTNALNRMIAIHRGYSADRFFHNQVIMITQNDYQQNLFNGDRGLVFVFEDTPYLFLQEAEDYRIIPAANLDAWETSFAMTVHKSQGSEFNEVFIFLPEGSEKLLSREILYTGITRARKKVHLFADSFSLDKALDRHVVRNSRIREVVNL